MQAALLLRLPRAALARRDAVQRLTNAAAERSVFAFKCDELSFARALLERRPNLWLYRTSQRAFAGDFVAVDVSSPRRASRRLFALELKRGERLRAVRTTAIQLQNTPIVIRALAAAGVVDEGCRVDALQGDAGALLEHLTRRR
jgi:hypothetical protein